jgi:lambda family phage portal protein
MLTALDRFTLRFAPQWTLKRVRARAAAEMLTRHYEAAQHGRRTSGWARSRGDANAVAGAAIAELRMHARDLVRNNGWAENAQRVIAVNTAGWGIRAQARGPLAETAAAAWKAWAESPACEVEGRQTFYGVQTQVMRTVPEAGEVLIRRHWRQSTDGLPLPLQLQVLEPDYIDTSKDGVNGEAGGQIIQGIEYDKRGRRAAYWLFESHPGSTWNVGVSKRVPAADIAHVFLQKRAGQARGISWFGAAIVPLKDLDEYEDAELMRQKIAACFAAFVTDPEGATGGMGEASTTDPLVETFEPGMIQYLPPGKEISTANPPTVVEGSFTNRHLRKVAKALGVTYEDLTGDYSQVNFSSARMGRLAHWANVRDWQTNMLIPQLCVPVWNWAMEAAVLAGVLPPDRAVPVDWTAPPMPMIEPDREGLAYNRLVRVGAMTHYEMMREQGYDPKSFLDEYEAGLKEIDRRGIKLDSDVRAVSQAGLTQERVGLGGGQEPEEEK